MTRIHCYRLEPKAAALTTALAELAPSPMVQWRARLRRGLGSLRLTASEAVVLKVRLFRRGYLLGEDYAFVRVGDARAQLSLFDYGADRRFGLVA